MRVFGVFAEGVGPSGSNFSAEKYTTPKTRIFASASTVLSTAAKANPNLPRV